MSPQHFEHSRKLLAVAICAYEITAVCSGERVPMITTLCRQHRWVEVSLLIVLLAHLHQIDSVHELKRMFRFVDT